VDITVHTKLLLLLALMIFLCGWCTGVHGDFGVADVVWQAVWLGHCPTKLTTPKSVVVGGRGGLVKPTTKTDVTMVVSNLLACGRVAGHWGGRAGSANSSQRQQHLQSSSSPTAELTFHSGFVK
jgi:hypothetical protein